jgi:hypothetical protein
MNKIIYTSDSNDIYKFDSGDVLYADAMKTIRDRINEIVEWINTKDNNQGGGDTPGGNTDPKPISKSISIKILY